MRSLIFIAALFAVLSCASADGLEICSQMVEKSVFYWCQFEQVAPFNVTNLEQDEVTFSVVKESVQTCDDPNTLIYGIVHNFANDCSNITGNGSFSYALMNSSNPNEGINIIYPPLVDTASNTSRNLIVQLQCDMNADDLTATNFTLSDSIYDSLSGNYTYFVTGFSKYGCPVFSFNTIFDFVANNQTAFSAVFGVIGLILTFFGLKIFRVAVFVIAFILGAVITGSLIFQLVTLGSDPWVLKVVFGVSIVLGLILAVLAIKLEKLGYFCIGGALGFVGGLMLYNGIISPIMKSSAGNIPLYITIVTCILLGGIIAFYVFESILIIATSLIGSYFVVRVISVYAGHFPNEAYVAEGLEKFDAITYAYLAGILVLAIIGMVVQFKTKSATEKEQDGEKQANYAYYRY